MKKAVLSILAVALLLAMVCGTAFAKTGDITIKSAKAYSDRDLKKYVTTIPKYTCVQVRAYGSYADIEYNGKQYYVKPSTLTRGERDYAWMGFATLPKGAKIYDHPTKPATVTKNGKKCRIKVYAINKGKALIRKGTSFGFVKADDLINMTLH